MNPTETPDLLPPAEAAAGPDFGRLLQRYLLPVGLCAAPGGDIFEQHAALQRNKRALRRWMPHYAKVHAVLAAGLLGVCSSASVAQVSGWVVAVAAVPTAGSMVLAVTFGCIALVLRLGND